MEQARKIEIAKSMIEQFENQLEATTFEGRICSKINDEKGLEQIKKRMADLQSRIDAGNELLKEYEKEN